MSFPVIYDIETMHKGIVKMPYLRQFQSLLLCRAYSAKTFKHRTRKDWQKLKREAFDTVTSPKDVSIGKLGGSNEIAEKVLYPSYQRVALTGKYDENTKRYKHIPEMVPEFVVPDLKGFKLKAYVPWGIEDVKQSEFTPRDLFFATYAKDIKNDFDDGKQELEDSEKEKS